VIEAPLLPIAPFELHGVATNVWVPIARGTQVKSKGVAESVFTTRPFLLNTTLFVSLFACAVNVQLIPSVKVAPLTNAAPPLQVNPLNTGAAVVAGVEVGVGVGVGCGVAAGVGEGLGLGEGLGVAVGVGVADCKELVTSFEGVLSTPALNATTA